MSQQASASIITFDCPSCGGQLTIPSNSGPLKGPCPLCGQVIATRTEEPISLRPESWDAAALEKAIPTRDPDPLTTAQPATETSQDHSWTGPDLVADDLPFEDVLAPQLQNRVILPPAPASEPPHPVAAGSIFSMPPTQALFCQCGSCGSKQSFDISQLGTFLTCEACHFSIPLPGSPQVEGTNAPIPEQRLSPKDAYEQTLTALQHDDTNNRAQPASERLRLLETFFELSIELNKASAVTSKPLVDHRPAVGVMAPVGMSSPFHIDDPVPIGNRVREYESSASFDQFERPMRIPSVPDFSSRSQNSGGLFNFGKAPPIESAKLLKKRRKNFGVPDGNAPVSKRKPSGTNVLEKVALLVFTLVVIGGFSWAGIQLYRKHTRPAAMSESEGLTTTTVSQSIVPAPVTVAEKEKIIRSIKGFHDATTVEAKAAFVVEGELMHNRLLQFYQRQPIEPLVARVEDTMESEIIENAHYLRARGVYESGDPFEILLLRQGDQFFIDWNAYVGYSQMDWMEFLLEQPMQSRVFRVTATPSEHFEFGYDDSIRYLCLALKGLNESQECYGYIDRSSPSGAALSRLFSTAGIDPRRITVQLAFEQKGLGKNQVSITEFVSGSWATPPATMTSF